MLRRVSDHLHVNERFHFAAALAGAEAQRLLYVARSEGLELEDARDAVQEALSRFIDLPQARALESSSREAVAYLSAIVQNVARNMRRRHFRARPHARDAAISKLEDASSSAEERVMALERQAQLRGCLASLEEVPRKIVSLRIMEEVPGSDVAKLLDLSPGHVAVLLHRAKKELSSCMTCF